MKGRPQCELPLVPWRTPLCCFEGEPQGSEVVGGAPAAEIGSSPACRLPALTPVGADQAPV